MMLVRILLVLIKFYLAGLTSIESYADRFNKFTHLYQRAILILHAINHDDLLLVFLMNIASHITSYLYHLSRAMTSVPQYLDYN